jgi:hypothetical protein
MLDEMISIFENANQVMLLDDIDLFLMKVSERTLCGALMGQLNKVLENTKYSQYYVDVEYNRNKGAKLKTYLKTMKGPEEVPVPIQCDLIVHSRGHNIKQDNLIALEMKKHNRPNSDKKNDRERVRILTKNSFDDVWSFDGTTLPEHVCRYKLGVYYEINFSRKQILVEYYTEGYFYKDYIIDYSCY